MLNYNDDGKVMKAATPNQPVEIEQSLEPSGHIHDDENQFHWFSLGMMGIYLAIVGLICAMILASWKVRCHRRKKE